LLHEGEPLRFDPIAAFAPADTTQNNPFWINNLTGQHLATTFADGTPLPDRGPYMQGPPGYSFVSDMTTPPAIGANCIGNPCSDEVIMSVNTDGPDIPPTDYPDFMEFSVQSQTHLNAQGICYIEGQHAADPYFNPNVSTVPYGPQECSTPAGCGGSSGSIGTTGGSTGTTGATTGGSTGTTSGTTGGSTGTTAGATSGGTTGGGTTSGGTTGAGTTTG
jgi:hypothetical protein